MRKFLELSVNAATKEVEYIAVASITRISATKEGCTIQYGNNETRSITWTPQRLMTYLLEDKETQTISLKYQELEKKTKLRLATCERRLESAVKELKETDEVCTRLLDENINLKAQLQQLEKIKC